MIYFAPTRLASEQSSDSPTSDEHRATLSVSSESPGAVVIVGADTIGTTPVNNHRLLPGTYLVTVDREGYGSRDTVVTLSADQAAAFTSRFPQGESFPGTGDQTDAPPPEGEPPSSPSDEPTASSTPPSGTSLTSNSPPGEPANEATDTGPQETSTASPDDGTTLATGTLVLQSTPERTTVELAGNEVGTTPTTLAEVAAGTYTVTFSRSGYAPTTRRIDVSRGDTVTVTATLEQQTGHLRVLVRPWGSIYIDDERRAENTDVWYDTALPVGSHTITARHPSLGDMSRSVNVAPRDTQSVILDLREQ